jgi:tetratricopeptide (TPR) repeat protein
VYFKRGDLAEAMKYLSQAEGLAERAERPDIISSVYNRLGGIHYQLDQFRQARDYVGKSIAIREEIGDVLGVARSYNNLANLSWKLGSLDEALENFKRSAELQTRLGDEEAIVIVNTNLGLLQTDRGYIEEARKYLEEALRRAERIEHVSNIALVNHHLSIAYVAEKQWQTALEYAIRSESDYKSLGEKVSLAEVYVNLGVIHLGLVDLQKAFYYGEESLALLSELAEEAETEVKGCALRLLGDVSLGLHNTDKAKKYYAEAEIIFKAGGNRLEQGRLKVSMARLAIALSNRMLAKTSLMLAQGLFTEVGARLELQNTNALLDDLSQL